MLVKKTSLLCAKFLFTQSNLDIRSRPMTGKQALCYVVVLGAVSECLHVHSFVIPSHMKKEQQWHQKLHRVRIAWFNNEMIVCVYICRYTRFEMAGKIRSSSREVYDHFQKSHASLKQGNLMSTIHLKSNSWDIIFSHTQQKYMKMPFLSNIYISSTKHVAFGTWWCLTCHACYIGKLDHSYFAKGLTWALIFTGICVCLSIWSGV